MHATCAQYLKHRYFKMLVVKVMMMSLIVVSMQLHVGDLFFSSRESTDGYKIIHIYETWYYWRIKHLKVSRIYYQFRDFVDFMLTFFRRVNNYLMWGQLQYHHKCKLNKKKIKKIYNYTYRHWRFQSNITTNAN